MKLVAVGSGPRRKKSSSISGAVPTSLLIALATCAAGSRWQSEHCRSLSPGKLQGTQDRMGRLLGHLEGVCCEGGWRCALKVPSGREEASAAISRDSA
eukprot:9682296-Alexandrium_andersonii.AAC.1